MTDPRLTGRLDKWLWQARFFKTRGIAAREIAAGHVRVNAARAGKPAQAVGPGDTLTFMQGRRVRVVRILALALRRGPAAEARTLYDDLSPERPSREPGTPEPRAGGRPSGKERRSYDRARRSSLE